MVQKWYVCRVNEIRSFPEIDYEIEGHYYTNKEVKQNQIEIVLTET